MTEEETLAWCLQQLQQSVQALALPATTQLALFPDFVCKAEELALGFDHWWLCVSSRAIGVLTEDQQRLLQEINSRLSRMSGAENAHLWTDDGLGIDPAWQQVRQLAQQTLAVFDWKAEVPPLDGTRYIGGRRKDSPDPTEA
jgi:hypothetical protein